MASAAVPGSARKSSSGERTSRFRTTYDGLFSGRDPSEGRDSFWEELFLLKVNDAYIRDSLAKISEADLCERTSSLNLLFRRCVIAMADSNQIRAANAMQTLGCFMSAIFAKTGFATFGFDVVNVIMGHDDVANQTKSLVDAVRHVLSNAQSAAELKELALCLLIVVVTATENINQNTLVGLLMDNCVFDDLLKLLDDRVERERHGFDVLLLLGVLVNYKKPEAPPADAKDAPAGYWKVQKATNDVETKFKKRTETLYEARRWNAYAERLEELSDDITLNAIGSVVSSSFSEDNRAWSSVASVEIKSGLWSSWLTTLLQDSVDDPIKLSIRPAECGAVLLSLYETVKLNAGFITTVTHTQVLQDPTPVTSPSTDVAAAETPTKVPPQDSSKPTNLLSTFLTFASFLMHDKQDSTELFSKLCWITFIRICEDGHTNEFLHTSEVPVSLYYMEMRHRVAELKSVKSGSLATALLDLAIEYLISHLKTGLQAEHYSLCIGVIHRLLCYQKEKHIRLVFEWKKLWGALMGLAGFIVSHEQALVGEYDIFRLANQVVNIFNIFITYGDTFLPDPASYDELYYEVIRVQSTFDSLYDMAKRHERGSFPVSAEQLASDLCNIRAITNHFNPLINKWKLAHGVHSLTPEQVLMVVNDNYETLTLKIKGILTYDAYVEEPSDASFFQELVTEVMAAHKEVLFKVTAIPITNRN